MYEFNASEWPFDLNCLWNKVLANVDLRMMCQCTVICPHLLQGCYKNCWDYRYKSLYNTYYYLYYDFLLLKYKSRSAYSEESPAKFNQAYFQVIVHKVAAFIMPLSTLFFCIRYIEKHNVYKKIFSTSYFGVILLGKDKKLPTGSPVELNWQLFPEH